MGKKVYAIKIGYDKVKGEEVKDLIVDSWTECEKYIKGVKGAKYKSFTTIAEAQDYLSQGDPILKKGKDTYPLDIHHAYVDGSYNIDTGKYSYGLLITKQNVVTYIENGVAADDSLRDIRQIAGELKASIRALQYCSENNIKELVIFHDYEGVCYHATGFWERKEESSRRYYEKFNKLVNEHNIKVYFVKVDSHTGDLYNEMVDEFAKAAGGLKLNYETEKLLKINELMVKEESLKYKLKEIIITEALLEKIKIRKI